MDQIKDIVMVSVICNTYNHELYIRDALEGFIKQKTNFAFEVLIHDDASTDNTADIIRDYEMKYPKLIKPIYQSINQYSQQVKINMSFQYPRVRGKYIALCEGDDYWVDPLKLQKQYDLMEKHSNIDICAHGFSILNMQNNVLMEKQLPWESVCIIPTKTVIKNGGEGFATASLFYKASLNKDIPAFRKIQPIDYSLQIHGSLNGGLLFLPDNMCVYRSSVPNSWTQRMKNNTAQKTMHKKKRLQMLAQLNKDTNGKYSQIIKEMQAREIIKIALLKIGFLK